MSSYGYTFSFIPAKSANIVDYLQMLSSIFDGHGNSVNTEAACAVWNKKLNLADDHDT